jgi:hypothetical protein
VFRSASAQLVFLRLAELVKDGPEAGQAAGAGRRRLPPADGEEEHVLGEALEALGQHQADVRRQGAVKERRQVAEPGEAADEVVLGAAPGRPCRLGEGKELPEVVDGEAAGEPGAVGEAEARQVLEQVV